MVLNIVRFVRDCIKVANSGLFSSSYYLETHPDLPGKVKIPLLHFMRRGWREGRNPSALFDSEYYKSRYTIDSNPLVHYLAHPDNFIAPFPSFTITYQETFSKACDEENPKNSDLVFICRGDVPEEVKNEMLNFPAEEEFNRELKLGVLLPNRALYETEESPFRGWIPGKSLRLRYNCFWIRGDLLKSIKNERRLFSNFSEDEIWESLPVILQNSGILFKEIDSGHKYIKKIFQDANRPKLTLDHRAISCNSKYKMSVAAVILNYNCAEDTKKAVASVQGQVDRVYVIDNNSDDFSELKFNSEVAIIRNPVNLGYAGGNNIGIRRAIDDGFSHLLVMNPDSRFSEVHKMLDHFRASSDIGIVSPKILKEDGSIWYSGFELDSKSFVPQQITELKPEPRDLKLFTGCVFMASAKCFEAVGLLLEEYFLYFEDCDFGLTTSSAGFRSLFDPRITATHLQTSTGGQDIAKLHYIYYFICNRIKFIRKWAPQKISVLFSQEDPFILGHRKKVEARKPEYSKEFDGLIERAIKDGLNDLSGATF